MGDLVLDGVVCVVDCRNVLKVGRAPDRKEREFADGTATVRAQTRGRGE